jgi:hypothetical protein
VRGVLPGHRGYADGLSPENVTNALDAIAIAHALLGEGARRDTNDPAWIDAETHLFTEQAGHSGNPLFDLEKVAKFAHAATEWQHARDKAHRNPPEA